MKQERSLKKIYDEVTEDVFDMINKKMKMWRIFTFCYVFGQLKSVG